MSRLSGPRAAGLAAAVVALVFLWTYPVMYPVRILVTLLHEFSHGLAAVATGGSIEAIVVRPDGSGLCLTRGGWRIAILPAGYIGSMVWGCGMLVLAARTRWDRHLSLGLGAALAVLTLVYVRNPFGLAYGLALGAAFAAAGRWLDESLNDGLLTFIGSANALYALTDLRVLLGSGSGQNDAAFFSREILPLPPVVWAVLWGLAAVAALWGALRASLIRGPVLHNIRS